MKVRGSFIRPLQVVLLVSMASTLLAQAAAEPVAGPTPWETTERQGPPGAAYSLSLSDLCSLPEVLVRIDWQDASHELKQDDQSLDVCVDEETRGVHQEGEAHAWADPDSYEVSVRPLREGPKEEEAAILEDGSTVKGGRRMSGPFWRDAFATTGAQSFVPREIQAILEDEDPTATAAPVPAGEVVFAHRSSQAEDRPVAQPPPLPPPVRASSLPPGAGGSGASPATFSPTPRQVAGASPFASLPAKEVVAGAVLAFAAFALYQRFTPASSFDHERRAAIHKALGEWPDGATSGDVARRLGMNRKTVDYHLTYLARLSKVRTGVDETGTRRYSLRPLPERKPLVERVLGVVRERPGVSILELAGALGVSRSAADRHAKALVIQGALESRLVEGERRLFASA